MTDTTTQQKKMIVVTAGGTGGHMFPAIALAQTMIGMGYTVTLLTDARGAEYAKNVDGLSAIKIPAASPSRGGTIGKLRFGFTLLRGIWAGRSALRRVNAQTVVGFGGYASFPASFAAAQINVPLILHEQNAYLGLANRKLASRAVAIATAFRTVQAVPSGTQREVTGNPVRAGIAALHDKPYPSLDANSRLNIFITGGSQGARVFSEVVPQAIALLDETAQHRLKIVQQCRQEDIEEVQAAYNHLEADVSLKTFFDDMPAQLEAAHLLICRAGASTCAEATAAGRPAVYVPYPHAADDHQMYNAKALEAEGAGWLAPQESLTAHSLANVLRGFLDDPSTLPAAAERARNAAYPDAAARLARLVERIVAEGRRR